MKKKFEITPEMVWVVKLMKKGSLKHFIDNLAKLEALIDIKINNKNLEKIEGTNLPVHEKAFNKALELGVDLKNGFQQLTKVLDYMVA